MRNLRNDDGLLKNDDSLLKHDNFVMKYLAAWLPTGEQVNLYENENHSTYMMIK